MNFDWKGKAPAEPFILARNWDRFGGRLSEILNGYYLSKRFNLNFKFIWPDEKRFPEMRELLSVFSEAFLANHLISEAQLEKAQILQVQINRDQTAQEFINFFKVGAIESAVTIADFFKVPIFKGEEETDVLRMFRDAAAEIWSDEVNALIDEVSTLFPHRNVLHARYGDLVSGAWSNFVDPTKYLTWNQISGFLQESAFEGKKVLLISDTKEIALAFPKFLEPVPIIDSSKYKFSQENLETLVDLFKMQSSAGVYSPTASAYSTLGGHLSGKPVSPLRVNRHVDKKDLRKILKLDSCWEPIPLTLRKKLISRDIDQEINRLDGVFDTGVFIKIARAAFMFDPKNACSINHYAFAQALNGRRDLSESLMQKSRNISDASAQVHQDPLYMSLLAEFLCISIGVIRDQRSLLRRDHILKKLASLRAIQKKLTATRPYQIDKGLVEDNVEEILRLLVQHQTFGNRIVRALQSQKLLKGLTKHKFSFLNNPLFLANFLVSLRIKLWQL